MHMHCKFSVTVYMCHQHCELWSKNLVNTASPLPRCAYATRQLLALHHKGAFLPKVSAAFAKLQPIGKIVAAGSQCTAVQRSKARVAAGDIRVVRYQYPWCKASESQASKAILSVEENHIKSCTATATAGLQQAECPERVEVPTCGFPAVGDAGSRAAAESCTAWSKRRRLVMCAACCSACSTAAP